ncbi:6-hydroxy-D-nicotine oxidase [Reticulibacter mediterranei]|uniref:6-hydroxy-D-nicotine oxidase n=1 Tax=Reticulibacter mediterranei TaxID=2778369 RepID=A0A8J3ISP5_9CHLR|nr:FAD-binding oxidoreductase [Reticulibacter mediterranei]GHO97835.1 6-hydroxy-D-nicotine oxidase [Reticulibacter mediterranei]
MTILQNSDHAFFKDLAALLTGQIIIPEDETYEQVRQIWNGGVTTRPAAFVRCANTQDVIHALRWVRSYGFPLSVRGGGHDFAGRALREHGIVIDCSPMREVTIDPQTHTARIQGGATIGDLIDASQEYGLATTTGAISGVGMAGLTLGGGYGPLMGAYGLTTDNLLSAQVVTADGQYISASATEHADLFWGLRGGGGNFGVVVSLEYRLHPVTTVLAGLLLYPLDQARAVFHFYNEFITTAPDELTIQLGVIQMPGGMPVLFLSPTYCGSLEAGERVLAPLRAFGKPLADQIQPIAYDALVHSADAMFPQGRHYFSQTRSLDGLRAETIEVLVESVQRFSSPFSAISIHHFHGAASRVSASAAAFAPRQDHLMVEIVAGWEPQSPEADQRHRQWAQASSDALAPYALKGGYINMLDEGEQERVPLTFGANYERLLALKRIYDPEDVFHSTIGHIML